MLLSKYFIWSLYSHYCCFNKASTLKDPPFLLLTKQEVFEASFQFFKTETIISEIFISFPRLWQHYHASIEQLILKAFCLCFSFCFVFLVALKKYVRARVSTTVSVLCISVSSLPSLRTCGHSPISGRYSRKHVNLFRCVTQSCVHVCVYGYL